MESRSFISYLLLLTLPVIFCQCTNSSGKAKEDQTLNMSAVRKFNTQRVQPNTVENNINITGRVVPLQRIDVIAQVQGLAQSTGKLFKEGVTYSKGQVMVSIDDTEFRNNLSASKSQFISSLTRVMSDLKIDYPSAFTQWDNYLEKLNVTQPLPKMPDVNDAQLRYFLSSNNIPNQYYTIKSQEEILSRYIITAPFTGAVTQSFVDPGGLISPGTKLGEFIRTDRYEMQAAVSAKDISLIKIGQIIDLTFTATQGKWQGKVNRIGKSIDPSTQSVAVYIALSGNDLKEGMYLEGKLSANSYEDAVEIPKELLTRKNQVHIIEDSTVKLKDVEPLEFKGENVIVKGLASGMQLITDPITTPIQGIAAASN